jgi:hypothetical protein
MKKILITSAIVISTAAAYAQAHANDNLFYNNGANVTVQTDALVTIQGDMTTNQAGVTGITHLDNNGFIWTQGNLYGDNAFKQTGTGTLRMQNKTALYTAPYETEAYQVIQGGYRVNGGQSAIAATDDGSFYDLELDNQAGLVFIKANTDVRDAVDFKPASVTADGNTIAPNGVTNRLLTYDPGTAAAPAATPANGINYPAVFGMMNNAAGIANFKNVSTNLTANTTTLDNAYVQGKLRRAINAAAGGAYGFPLGLEPGTSATAARGIQYNSITTAANTYDVVTGYFQQGSSNAGAVGQSAGCAVVYCTYGTSHGEWNMTASGPGTEAYSMTIYPQDYADPCSPGGQYAITKNDAFSGTGCGATPLGLVRTGMSGFSDFDFAKTTFVVPVTVSSFTGVAKDCGVLLRWTSGIESNFEQYNLQHSADGITYETIATIPGRGDNQSYSYTHPLAFKANFYRLVMIDRDGSSSQSSVLSVNNNGCNEHISILMPNIIANGQQAVLKLSGYNGHITGSLYNAVGQRMKVMMQLKNGYNNINIENVVSGTYILQVLDDATGGIENIKMIVK